MIFGTKARARCLDRGKQTPSWRIGDCSEAGQLEFEVTPNYEDDEHINREATAFDRLPRS
jgi:hypothetical protein